jgi:hypothetical protein
LTVRLLAVAASGAGLLVSAAFPAATALADPLPVVAVHREIGLAAEGQFTNYKENFSAAEAPGAHDRETGGAPGFEFKAEDMFDIGRLRHVYLSTRFRYNNGSTTYNGASQISNTPFIGRSSLETEDLRAELGKGFLLSDRLLVTPVLQFEYHHWDRGTLSNDEDYEHLALGLAVKADYQLLPRLVLSARLGWAETINPHMTATDSFLVRNWFVYPLEPMHFDLGERPVWQAGGALDYRVLRHLHVYGGVDFERYGYAEGRAFGHVAGITRPVARFIEPDSWTQTIVLTTGAAWSF